MQEFTTTLPEVPAFQNGTLAGPASRKEYFNINGRRTWVMDERGFLTAYFYDHDDFGLVRMIQDVDVTAANSISLGCPADWDLPSRTGLNLVTDYENDSLARPLQVLGPVHEIDLDGAATTIRRAMWMVYLDEQHERRSAQGYVRQASPTSACVFNPVSITRRDSIGRVIDQISTVRMGCGCGVPTIACDCDAMPLVTGGRISATEEFPQENWCRWSSYQYDDSADLVSQRLYFCIPDFGSGRPVYNYAQTDFAYDEWGRRNKTTAPGGTITLTTFTAIGWEFETFVGTIYGGTEDNMEKISRKQYDGATGSTEAVPGRDGNLTTLTLYTGDATITERVTKFTYDCRDRQIVVFLGGTFRDRYTYDNQDRTIMVQREASSGGTLLAQSTTDFDDQGRVWRSTRYSVASGTVGNSVCALTWYDAAGNVLKQRPMEGQAYSRMEYDSLGRMIVRYLSVHQESSSSSSSSSSSPGFSLGSILTDLVVEQSESVYDAASNVIFQSLRQRFHDAPTSGAGSAGPLGDPLTAPKARVYYSAAYPDPLGRSVAGANFGTNGGVAPVRPAEAPESTDLCLVSQTRYSACGTVQETEDANGTVTRQENDDAGRVIKTIENFQPSH